MWYRPAILLPQILAALSLVSMAQTMGSMNAAGNTPLSRSPGRMGISNTGSISGMVRTFDGHGAGDVRVEVKDIRTGQVFSFAYTNNNGVFEIMNVPNGNYEVVATSGVLEWHDRVIVENSDALLSVRLSPPAVSAGGGRNSVSVAQMKVPEKARDLFKKAEAAAHKDKSDEAAKYVAQALSVCPNFSEALTLRGILRLDGGQTVAAREDLEKAVESDGNYSLAYLALGAVYNLESRWDDAIRSLNRGVTLSPQSWQGYFELGKSFLGKGDYKGSLQQLARAEARSPKYAALHLVKAHALLGLKNYSDAMTELETYLERDPKGLHSAQARETLDKVRAFTRAAK